MFVYTGEVYSGVWGISVVGQLANDPDSHVVLGTAVIPGVTPSINFVDTLLGDWECTDWDTESNCMDSTLMSVIDFRDFRSTTLIVTAASTFPDTLPPQMQVAYVIYNATQEALEDWKNRPAAGLTPYPNPAVVSELTEALVNFRFQVPTDNEGYPVDTLAGAFVTIDIYTVAGEYLAFVEGSYLGEDRLGNGVYEAAWDMKNETGRDVASGVYLAYARLYFDIEREELLAESHQKVVIIR